jgi:hypothetical protein
MQPELSSAVLRAPDVEVRHGFAGALGAAARKLLSFPMMLAAGLAVITALTVSSRFDDPDLWFHLKLGQVVWTTHSIPSTDIFSFTAQGHAWIAHEWLAELGTYAAYRLGGYTGLMLCFVGLASLLFALVYFLCYQRCGSWLTAFLGGVCAWYFATPGLAIRPLLLGHLLLVIELILLGLASRNRGWLWLLPPLFALWVNCHGSYFFGMGVLGVYWLCSFAGGRWGFVVAEARDSQYRKALGVTLVLCVLALCANPIGIRLLLYPLNVAFHQSTAVHAVQEWLPPDLQEGRAWGMIGAVIGILLLSSLHRLELPLREMLVLAAAFALGLQHARMLFVFGIVVSPVVCQVLAPLLGRDREREHPVANGLLLCAFMAAIVWGFPSPAGLQRQVTKQSPVGAVDYIRRARLSGPMLNEYVFGDYLIWALPEEKDFIDGRGDVFDWAGVFQEYGLWFRLQEDPRILLNKYKIRFCVISKGAPMTHVLPYLPGWRQVYADDVATVFAQ